MNRCILEISIGCLKGIVMTKFNINSNKTESRPLNKPRAGETIVHRNSISGDTLPPKTGGLDTHKGIIMKPTVVTKPK